MKKRVSNNNNRKRGNYVVLSLVSVVFGFLLSYSYHLTTKSEQPNITNSQWNQDMALRDELIQVEEKNRELETELRKTQERIVEIEKELANEEREFFNLAEDTEKYRIFLGEVKVKGEGIKVTLEDGEYNPQEDANNYIVHEHHVFKVINELYVSGAHAISVNGQRLTHNSYIICNGPVIEVDGTPHPAPFIIEAIGDAETMAAALDLPGGVKDLLVNENIQFSLEQKKEIIMDPVLRSSS